MPLANSACRLLHMHGHSPILPISNTVYWLLPGCHAFRPWVCTFLWDVHTFPGRAGLELDPNVALINDAVLAIALHIYFWPWANRHRLVQVVPAIGSAMTIS